MAIFDWLLGMLKAPKPPTSKVSATIIDQSAYYDLLERKQKALLEDIKQLEADRRRISVVVRTWARDCEHFEEQRPMPTKSMPIEVQSWLLGLSAREVMALARTHDAMIHDHMFAKVLISGVRAVQRLRRQPVLRFPKPPVAQDPRRRMA